MGVRGQYLKAVAIKMGTATTVTPARIRPARGPVVGLSRKAMTSEAMKATPERMLIRPPVGMKTSSTTSAQPTTIRRMAQASSGITMLVMKFCGRVWFAPRGGW